MASLKPVQSGLDESERAARAPHLGQQASLTPNPAVWKTVRPACTSTPLFTRSSMCASDGSVTTDAQPGPGGYPKSDPITQPVRSGAMTPDSISQGVSRSTSPPASSWLASTSAMDWKYSPIQAGYADRRPAHERISGLVDEHAACGK
jgi:hypothetical protein